MSLILTKKCIGTPGWLSQLSVQLDLGSGHDLSVCGMEPHIGLCADSADPAWNSLFPFLSALPLLYLSPHLPLPTCTLSLSQE